MVFVQSIPTIRNVNKDCVRKKKGSQIFGHFGGAMDCVAASYAEVPLKRNRNLCLFHSIIIPPPPPSLFNSRLSVSLHSYSRRYYNLLVLFQFYIFISTSKIAPVTIWTIPNQRKRGKKNNGAFTLVENTMLTTFVNVFGGIKCYQHWKTDSRRFATTMLQLYVLTFVCNIQCELSSKKSHNLCYNIF